LCYNNEDPITGESFSDASLDEDIISILPAAGGLGEGGFCIRRPDLLKAMDSTELWRWIPYNVKEPEFGKPDKRFSYFKLPLGFWVDQNAYKNFENPQTFLYVLEKKPGTELIGTAFGMSAAHGQEVSIYTAHPVMSIRDMIADQKRRYQVPAPKLGQFEDIAGLPTIPTEQVDSFCDAFLKDSTINPKTGRRIKKNGPTYKKLMKRCS
jgi:hypothetical protein